MSKSIHILSALSMFMLLFSWSMEAQVGVNSTNSDPNPSAMLDIQSTDKGMLMPRMTTSQRDAIPNPVAGLMIFNLTDSCFNYYIEEQWVKDCGRSLDIDLNSATNHFGGSGEDSGLFIDTDAAGNIYMGGYFETDLTIGDNVLSNPTAEKAVYLLKIAPSGEILWHFQLGGNGDQVGVEGISVDAAGNLFITGVISGTVLFGSTSLTANNIADLFFAKYDTDGNIIWAKQGGIADLGYGSAITTDALGNILIAGSEIDIATDISSATIYKYDANGNFLWSQKSTANGDISATEIVTDPSGNVGIVGTMLSASTATLDTITFNSIGSPTFFIAKFNGNGDILWVRLGGGSGGGAGFANDIAADIGGNMYVLGSFAGSTTLGGTYLGNSPSNLTFGIGKFDPNGTLIWGDLAVGIELEGQKLDLGPAGNVFFTGSFRGITDFGGSLPTIASAGSDDIIVGKYDANGNILWAKKAGGVSIDAGRDIAVNTSGNVFVTGVFKDWAIIGGQNYVGSGEDEDAFLWMLQGDDGDNFDPPINDISGYQSLYSDVDPTNEWQNLSLSGDDLSIENGNSVNLSSIDNQTLSLLGNILSIDNGNSVDLSSVDKDNDQQTLSLTGSDLSILNGNSVDLSGVWPDTQMISLTGSVLNITNGNSANISGVDTDTDHQTFTLSGNILSIEDGNNVDLSGVGSDNQMLTLSGSFLSISGGNNIDLSPIDTDTDDQTLSFDGQKLTISDGNFINLNSINSDAQNLNLSGTTLSIDNSNSVTLPLISDNLGDHIANQNLDLDGYYLSGDGDFEGVFIYNNGEVGIGTTNPVEMLHVKTSGYSTLEYGLAVQNPFNSSSGRVGILFSADAGDDRGKGALAYHGKGFSGAGDFVFLQSPNSSAGNPTINDVAMVINENGNVGIGQDDPMEKLEVAGNLQLENDFAKVVSSLKKKIVALRTG